MRSYRSIKLPYFYKIETARSNNKEDILQRIERSLLAALAEILTCTSKNNEDTRRSLRVGAQQNTNVIATYSLSDDTISVYSFD
mmetsp:Transcript_1780/g.3817  ORF Transcript_1780/g.3817 Transcript_1780/m.3817 type:complete len:84 (+) Transcript_1780:483-734(+)